jgi:creatinine amidohydrolase
MNWQRETEGSQAMEFGRLTYEEVKEAVDQDWIVLIPTGCTEQQGPHLPVDFDTWCAYQVCLVASDCAWREYSISSLVLPALPFGPTPEHRNFGSGFIDLPQALHEDVVRAVIRSLLDQGFRRIIIWRGCGQHDLAHAIASIESSISTPVHIWQPEPPYSEIWKRVNGPDVAGGHADSFATSIALFLRPDVVRKDRIEDPMNLDPDWDDPNLDFAKYSKTGVIGDPTAASEELGAKLWAELTREVAEMIRLVNERR